MGEFDFGITGYEPRWLDGAADNRATHESRLAALAGRRIRHVWLAWELDDDLWCADWPVLVELDDGHQIEINHKKTDCLSITYDGIDRTVPIRMEMALAWRADPLPELAGVIGREIRAARVRDGPAVTFDLKAVAALAIVNAGDENGIEVT